MSHALVIGAGPAGLMAADVLSAAGHQVTIADQMPSVGRKFLMAGKSGLNLTKAEPLADFLHRYDAPGPVLDAVRAFGPEQVQGWARGLGQSVFTGSTGRVFPDVMKASPLLRAWLAKLRAAGCQFHTGWRWDGWNDGAAVFETPEGRQVMRADVTILALGGGSWARLGSDGSWVRHLDGTVPFKPSNCGFAVGWSDYMAPFFGQPVKATCLTAGALSSRGEWVLTKSGIEGGGVYEVSAAVREGASLAVDLLPDVSEGELRDRVATRGRKASRNELLRKVLRLSPIKTALINEFGRTPGSDLITIVKTLDLGALAPFPIDTAISTAGGVDGSNLVDGFMLSDRPGVFAAGEMLDWDAPTGGYLITACLATGRAAAQAALDWLTQAHGPE